MKSTSKDLEISSPIMTGSSDVETNGIIVSEKQNILKDILSLTQCIVTSDSEEDDILSEETDSHDTQSVSSNIDAYIAAQILTDIKDKSKYVFSQKAIERSIEKSGTFDENDLIIGKQAFIAGTLTVSFLNALTKLDLISEENVFLRTYTTADLTKAFMVGCGISWLGSKGRYSIALAAQEAKLQENSSSAMGGDPAAEDQGFAEGRTPGKKAINDKNLASVENTIDKANSIKDLKVKPGDSQAPKTGDTLMGESLNSRRLELLTFKDFFAFINNFLINDVSKVKMTSVVLMKNLSKTNFQSYLDKTSNNIWEDKYGLQSLVNENVGTDEKKKINAEKKEVFDPLESKAYEYLALLTLISRDVTELYIKQRYIGQRRMMEEQEQVAAEQEQAVAEQEQAAADLQQQQQQIAVESDAVDVEVKKKGLKGKKNK